MVKFLQCEFITFVKLIGFLIVINLVLKFIGIEPYMKVFLSASLIGIILYLFVFIWKLIHVLMIDNVSKYQCENIETVNKALSWLSNIV